MARLLHGTACYMARHAACAGGNALQLSFVFGYTGRRVRQNLFYNAHTARHPHGPAPSAPAAAELAGLSWLELA